MMSNPLRLQGTGVCLLTLGMALPGLTRVPESMDEAPGRFPVIHRVAGRPQHKEATASFGLVASSDQWVLLFELTP